MDHGCIFESIQIPETRLLELLAGWWVSFFSSMKSIYLGLLVNYLFRISDVLVDYETLVCIDFVSLWSIRYAH